MAKTDDFSSREWEHAKKKFADQQFSAEVLGENTVLSWLKMARRSLAQLCRRTEDGYDL